MDADEMNAYAEGELPEAARHRYVAHLADCDQCRTIVTGLTLSANLPVKDEERAPQQTHTPQRSWREWLAALFAPPMIRYGAMALALLCVVGVVFLAMRQQRSTSRQDGPTLIAQNQEGTQQPASAVKSDSAEQPVTGVSPGTTTATNNQAVTGERAENPARTPDAAKTEGTTDQAQRPQTPAATSAEAPAASAANAPATVSSTEAAPKPVAKETGDQTLADRDSPAPPVQQPAASPGLSAGRSQETTETDRIGQMRRDKVAEDERAAGTGVMGNVASTREAEETVRLRRPASRRRGEARQKSEDKVQTLSEGTDTNSTTASRAGARAAETRSVGGRQFRREGGAWVDTAYSSGRATVNIRRGSEQYRALVADEPGIGTIANQLGGEVIVVWKARAYRIR
jgi:hypothetical protein